MIDAAAFYSLSWMQARPFPLHHISCTKDLLAFPFLLKKTEPFKNNSWLLPISQAFLVSSFLLGQLYQFRGHLRKSVFIDTWILQLRTNWNVTFLLILRSVVPVCPWRTEVGFACIQEHSQKNSTLPVSLGCRLTADRRSTPDFIRMITRLRTSEIPKLAGYKGNMGLNTSWASSCSYKITKRIGIENPIEIA